MARTSSLTPLVSLVIPSYNGGRLLRECLDSIAALEYPRELFETIVVDNGSTDDSLRILDREYPWVRVLPQSENLGFAEGVNVGARAASGELLALANNDMRFDRAWLSELVAAYAPAEGYRCVAGVILDAAGERVDFAGGYVSFYGMGGQEGFGRPIAEVEIEDGNELLFACGGSMLVERSLFVELGGFDESFFAYFEDVDFGWRLWLAGHKVRLAAGARSFHHHHGTASAFPVHQRAVLYDRNALLMLVKNLGDENLYPILAAALALTVERALADSGSDRRAYEFGAPASEARETVPASAVARLHAVAQFVDRLDTALAERKQVQSRRRRSDDEIFALFRRPFWPLYREERYLEASARLVRAFGIGGRFPNRRATLALLVGAGGASTAELARNVSRLVRVVVVTREPLSVPGIETFQTEVDDELAALVRESDVVVVESGAPDGDAAASIARNIRPVVPLGAAQSNDPLAELRPVLEQPWRFGLDTRSAATEELQVLASVWRALPARRPLPVRAARVLWGHVPEAVRRPLRPIVRKLGGATGG